MLPKRLSLSQRKSAEDVFPAQRESSKRTGPELVQMILKRRMTQCLSCLMILA